jgi:hypothetical protein
MFLSQQKDTEDLIIERLGLGPVSVNLLINDIAKAREITKYGVYKALRKLKTCEVIMEHKKVVSLSIPWVHRMTQFTDTAIQGYSLANYSLFQGLEEGKRVVFSFQDLVSFDNYWMHMMITLLQRYDEPFFLYAEHDWFVVVRPKAKLDLFSWIETNKRISFMLIGSNSKLDYEASEKSKLTTMEVAVVEEHIFKEYPYGAIIGDFFIESRFEKSIAEEIDQLYQTPITLEELKQKVIEITSRDQDVKIIVTRNKERARQYRKRMAKHFYIPKEIRDKI